jgi:hypothetical protein
MLNLYLTAEIAESAEKNLNLFWKLGDHEKNDGPIFHAGFRVKTKVKSLPQRDAEVAQSLAEEVKSISTLGILVKLNIFTRWQCINSPENFYNLSCEFITFPEK